jgi:hypothetical protein
MILAEKQGNNSDFNSNDLDWTFISKTGIWGLPRKTRVLPAISGDS